MKQKVLIIVILLLLGLFLVGCSSSSGEEGSITIPLNDVTSKVQKYEFDASGVTVRFFTVKDASGEIKTAFDACDVCGGNKGGYMQQGDDIKCKNCGRVFSIEGLGTQNKGYGCWPSHLNHEIVDGNVVIIKQELSKGAHRFA